MVSIMLLLLSDIVTFVSSKYMAAFDPAKKTISGMIAEFIIQFVAIKSKSMAIKAEKNHSRTTIETE